MNIKEALKKLYSIHQFSIKLGLDNIIKLLDYLDNPQNKFQSIHIAGSNGKGSTASFLSSIMIENGMKTGLYTSPHFVRFNERVRINGIEIPDEFITQFMNDMNSYIDKYSPTFFEITTAIAFKYFAEQKIDIGIIETGLGGRLDATNTINPLASIITSISLEHTNILGNSIEEIAKEKAGIIKKDVPIIIGDLSPKAINVISEKSNEIGTKLFDYNSFANFQKDHVLVTNKNFRFNIYKTPLLGQHQLKNSSVAVYCANEIFNINEKVIIKGINKVKENSGIEGRYEIYNENPKVIFDAGHNLEGIEVFVEEFQKEKNSYKKCSVIFGAMNDKDLSGILNHLNGVFDKFYFTNINYERAIPKEVIADSATKMGLKFKLTDLPADIIKEFISIKKEECLVVLGSIYLLGEIKDLLSRKNSLTF